MWPWRAASQVLPESIKVFRRRVHAATWDSFGCHVSHLALYYGPFGHQHQAAPLVHGSCVARAIQNRPQGELVDTTGVEHDEPFTNGSGGGGVSFSRRLDTW